MVHRLICAIAALAILAGCGTVTINVTNSPEMPNDSLPSRAP